MKTIKQVIVTPEFVMYMPPIKDMQEGVIYISDEFKISIHLCLCGCRNQTVMPLNKSGWNMIKHDEKTISFTPSIGNYNYPCRSHYIITKNKANFV